VDRVGVIGRDNQIVFSVPVEKNVYTAGKKAFPGGRGIVALDKDGKVLWVQCSAERSTTGPAPQFPSGGCGKYKSTLPPKVPAVTPSRKSAKPTGPLVVQRGRADGVSVIVRGAEIQADLSGISAEKRRLLVYKDGRIVIGCFKLVTVGGATNASGVYVTEPFRTIVRVRPYGGRSAPFDGCTASGRYGKTWNDGRGTHDLIEVPLTAKGRRYLLERAAARDIAWLARARVFREIRYGRQPLSTEDAARRLGGHVVPLGSPDATPPIGKLGVWLGDSKRLLLVERATTGRRLYLEIRRGIIYRTNLLGLA
jgi:hypothetical protein